MNTQAQSSTGGVYRLSSPSHQNEERQHQDQYWMHIVEGMILVELLAGIIHTCNPGLYQSDTIGIEFQAAKWRHSISIAGLNA